MDPLPAAPGTLVTINSEGRRIHALIAGDPALPTLVLDSGLGANALAFTSILDQVSEFAHVIAFDRAGYPWSDPAPAGSVLDARHTVEDARALVRALERKPPYILGGLSYGGITMLTWALTYPAEVAALALIESSTPEMYKRMPRMPSTTQTARQMQWFARVAAGGWLRWLPQGIRLRVIPGMAAMHEPWRTFWAQVAADARTYETAAAEARVLESSLQGAHAPSGALGNMPLVVMTGARMWSEGKGGSLLLRKEQKRAMLAMRAELAALSHRGVHQLVEGAGHLIPLERPQSVIEALQELARATQTG